MVFAGAWLATSAISDAAQQSGLTAGSVGAQNSRGSSNKPIRRFLTAIRTSSIEINRLRQEEAQLQMDLLLLEFETTQEMP